MSTVVVERRGPALWARIDRPGAGNACSSAVMAGLEDWLDRAGEPGVAALVLTGTGRSFCAGADLTEGQSLLGDPPALRAFLERGRDLVGRVREAGRPTIAAVNGAAYGGGLELLLACDIAVAGASARIGDRHVAVGQVPGWGSSAMLPKAVGPAIARRLLITGETWTAEQAAGRGLVSEAVPDTDLDDHVLAIANRIAGLDPVAVARMLKVARGHGDEDAWSREARVLREHIDGQIAAFTAARRAR
ncbi:enoyl-CoA hydratase/isomerase family protein [Actinomadura barringtoniae]|uniref:Enoyl-CoA hydratase/isomerase family protein n=1 Tax=Actinomadura barringtoniae TaxID=1427535 RepID=A0A939PEM6_9ACTN|nr:enoyl-CoA hydratase/isomerase family protein [Actinomadura barringtoniae]MBO2447814.1 enoyl-CoA hydratase/isomerase family protein [Actinomadura barringtoniae]